MAAKQKQQESSVDFSAKDMTPESILNHKAQNDENAEQRMAFEIYYRAGQDRSIIKVANQVGKAKSTVELWSRKYRWQPRVKEREKIAAEHNLTVQAIVEESELKKKHVRIIDAVIVQAVQQFKDKAIKIKSTDELLRLIDTRWKIAAAAAGVRQGANNAGGSSMNIHGPVVVDLGLSKMPRGERLQFIQSMLVGIQRVSARPSLRDRAVARPDEVLDIEATAGATESFEAPALPPPDEIELPEEPDDPFDFGVDLEV